jgi:thiol-disulfide isomerase/thioredoxin
VLAALVAFSVALLVIGLLPSHDARVSAVGSPNNPRLLAAPHRRLLPPVSGSALDPPPDELTFRTRGQVGFVDLWASWCTACREEAPMLGALSRTFAGKVQFFGVDVNDTRAAAQAFESRFGATYPSIFDPHAHLVSRLGVEGLPTAFLIDRRGRIAAVLIGRQSRQVIVSLLRRLAAASPGP